MRRSARVMVVVAALAASLSGCVMPGGQSTTDRAEVLEGTFVLAAPRGYCIDPASRRDGAAGAFLLWGNCAAISGNPTALRPAERALLSATVGPALAGDPSASFAQYEAFFRSDAGRAALARSGHANDVRIEAVRHEKALLLLKITDRSASSFAPVAPTYWRAVTGLGGHIGTLSVLPVQGARLDDATQVTLLHAFEQAIRAAN